MSEIDGGQATGETTDNGGNDGGLDPNLYPGIEDVPQEYRQYVDPILKEVNASANKHVSDVNSKLESWKPYEELGVNEIDKEDLEGLLGFYQMVAQAQEDPTKFKAWWENVGNEFGFAGDGEDDIDDDDFGSGEGNGSGITLEQVAQMLDEKISPFAEKFQEREFDDGLKAADETVEGEYSQIRDKYPNLKLTEKMESDIATFGLKYQDMTEGAVLKGFDDWKAFHDEAKGSLFDEIERQPDPGEGPGTPNTNIKPVTNFKDAEAAVKAAMENAAKP